MNTLIRNFISFIIVISIFGCQKIDLGEYTNNNEYEITNESNNLSSSNDTIAYESNLGTYIMLDTIINIKLSKDTIPIFNNYRIPYKSEKEIIQSWDLNLDYRILCIDENNQYWTFNSDGSGKLSKAGTNTYYSIIYIKLIENNKQINDTIQISPSWDGNINY